MLILGGIGLSDFDLEERGVVVVASVGGDDATAVAASEALYCFQFFGREFGEIEFVFHDRLL
jgi:hypothetical protein